MSKIRLDVLLFQRNLVESRERANAVIMSGGVYVEGSKALKPGIQVNSDAHIEIRESLKYVSRGGLKLEKALNDFEINPKGMVCIDCGASTGGFTDCLLQNGAKLVYAIDVGYGQLAWSIRSDSRVVTMERTNIRNVTADMFELKPQLAVVDVSFISLKLVLPVLKEILSSDGQVVCLIKPQFEAGKEKVGKNGVVRDTDTKINVLDDFIENAEQLGFRVKGLTYSPIKGPKGNIEFLCRLGYYGESTEIDTRAVVIDGQEKLGD